MESTIEQIYYGDIRKFDCERVSNSDEESKVYEAIYNRLHEEEKALFNKF